MNVHEFIENPHPFLSGLGKEHLRILAGFAMQTRFAAGAPVFREGELANRFYLIQRGKVLLDAQFHSAPPIPVQVINSGDVLGWSWLFPPHLWHFDATAIDETAAIFFYATRLREECETDKTLGYELLKRVAEIAIHRLQATRMKLTAQPILPHMPPSEVPAGG